MKERPILFSANMVRAILDGHKVQTRRALKLPKWSTLDWDDFELDDQGRPVIIAENTGCWSQITCPYGSPGDHLWVREKHTIECPYGPAKECDNPDHVTCWATEEPAVRDSISKWRPSSYMPRWASRITLQITDIQLQLLQDISLADIKAEGVSPEPGVDGYFRAWRNLWDSINGKKSAHRWMRNPWVWAVTFEKEEEREHG